MKSTIFKLRQGASIIPNVGRLVGRSVKKNMETYKIKNQIHCHWKETSFTANYQTIKRIFFNYLIFKLQHGASRRAIVGWSVRP